MEPSNGFISSGFMQLKKKMMMVLIDSSIKFESHVKLGSDTIWTEQPEKDFDVFFFLWNIAVNAINHPAESLLSKLPPFVMCNTLVILLYEMMWLSNLKIWEGPSQGALKYFIGSRWD